MFRNRWILPISRQAGKKEKQELLKYELLEKVTEKVADTSESKTVDLNGG